MAWRVLKHQRSSYTIVIINYCIHIFIVLNSDIKSRKVIKKLAIRAAAFIGIYFICGIPCKYS